jgi:hypothetical protein
MRCQALSRLTPQVSTPQFEAPRISNVTDVYEWNVGRAQDLGIPPESREYMRALEDWRNAWRPMAVKTLLIAESHVRELHGDSAVRVSRQPGGPELTSYCRLIYCLGYGDSRICCPPPASNGGTPDFWRILSSIAGLERPSTTMARIAVLTALRDAGVWLVDACVTGVYMPGGGRIATGRVYRELVRDSYRRFVEPGLQDDPIERVLVIGKMVHDAIGDDVRRLTPKVSMMVAPGARQRSGKWESLDQFVAEIRDGDRRLPAAARDTSRHDTTPEISTAEYGQGLDTSNISLRSIERSLAPPSPITSLGLSKPASVHRPDATTWALSCSSAEELVDLISGPWLDTVDDLAPGGRDALRGTTRALCDDMALRGVPAGPLTIMLTATAIGPSHDMYVGVYPGRFEDIWEED